MNKSKISKVVLMSAAALSSGLFLQQATASALTREGFTGEGYGHNDRYTNFEQYLETVRALQARIADDAAFQERYLANPRAVLSEAGLPVDLQLEMMREDGLAYGPAFAAADCICTQTCLKTN
jgi:hypothetical protein